MKVLPNFVLPDRMALSQLQAAPPEDRALRGRNLSAELEPDRRQVGSPNGGPAGQSCRNLHKAKNPLSETSQRLFAQTRRSNEVFVSTLKTDNNKLTNTPKPVSIFSGEVHMGDFGGRSRQPPIFKG